MLKEEEQAQIAFVKWFNLQYPHYAHLLQACAAGGMRNKIEAAKLKLMGVKAGIPDLQLMVPRGTYHGLFIELKSKEGRLKPIQQFYLEELTEQQYAATWCRGWEEAKEIVEEYLGGKYDARQLRPIRKINTPARSGNGATTISYRKSGKKIGNL